MFGPAASDQNALSSSILPSCSGTTPAERKDTDVTEKHGKRFGVREVVGVFFFFAQSLVIKGNLFLFFFS